MVAMTPYEELGQVLKLKRKDGESFDGFTARTTKKINALKDPEWNALTEKLQIWHNKTAEIREKASGNIDEAALPELEGWPEEADSGDELVADDEANSDEQESGGSGADDADAGEEAPTEDDDGAGQEDVDAAADSEQESGDVEVTEAPKPKRSAKKAATAKAPAKKPVVATAPPQKPKTSTPKATKEKETTMSAKKTTVAAAKPAAKKAATNGVAKIGRQSRLGESDKIKILVKENPHREGTGRFKRWEHYKDGMTVGQALKAGLKPVNIHYSVADGHIKIVHA
jgi:hypothetical protein